MGPTPTVAAAEVMRRATGGIIAPVLYHAACNLLVEFASLHYG